MGANRVDLSGLKWHRRNAVSQVWGDWRVTVGTDAEATDILRKSALFQDLDGALFAEICADARVSELARGQILFQQHDPARTFFVVLDGWVKVFRMSPRGEEAVIGIFTRGESFAEIAALAGNDYPASAEAVADTRLAAVSVERLTRRISEDPSVALAMLASVSRQMHRLVDEIEQMKGHSGIQRVAEFLARHCNVDEGACVVRLPYEKALIAGKLGMKAESLSRVFQRLRARGVVIRGEMAMINDVATLRDIVDRDSNSALG